MEENQNIPLEQPTESRQLMVASGSKREWTSYIKEFIMLFLAVFTGFLAENYRENLSDQQKEKEYIHSLVKDVELDIIYLNPESVLEIYSDNI